MKKAIIVILVVMLNQLTAQNNKEIYLQEIKDMLQGGLNPERSCFDVKFYDIKVKILPRVLNIIGSVRMDFLITKKTKFLQLDLDDALHIDSIVFEGKRLHFKKRYGGECVLITFPDTLLVNSIHSLTTFYHGMPISSLYPPSSNGFVWKENANLPWIGVACEMRGASLWLPCKDHPSDEPDSVGIHITIPKNKNLSVVANGRLRAISTSNSIQTFYWFVSYPINLYNITFYVGNFVHLHDEMQGLEGKIDIDFYVLREHRQKIRTYFPATKELITFYELTFGPYPWIKDGYKLVESPFAGMEHQSAIAYGSRFSKNPKTDRLLIHGTAHEWWGNSITADDMAELWIHEGFASYAEGLYVEHLMGMEAYLIYLDEFKREIIGRKPLLGIRNRHFDCTDASPVYFNGDIYYKGAWVLHTLRSSIHNDTLFKEIIFSFAIENREKVLNTETFITHVNNKTKKLSKDSIKYNYTAFFNEYLTKTSTPILIFYYRTEHKQKYFYYRWINTNDDFCMPIHIMGKDQTTTYSISPTKKFQRIAVAERLFIQELPQFYLIKLIGI